MTLCSHLFLLVRVSRVAGWCFGPILYTIGVLHSRDIPKAPAALLRYCIQVASLSFPLCIVVFGVNDVYDYDSDLRNPRKTSGSLEGGVLEPLHHSLVIRAAIWSSAFILLCSLLPLISIPSVTPTLRVDQSFLLTTLLLTLSWGYSAPPVRLKERPVLDSLSNGAIVWLCWAIGYVAAGKPLFSFAASEGAGKGWLLAFCTSGVHALGAAADLEADIAAGQRTIATLLGKRVTGLFSALCYLVALMTVESTSFVGLYTCVGMGISLVPALAPSWTHASFKAIVYASVGGAIAWIGERALGILKAKAH